MQEEYLWLRKGCQWFIINYNVDNSSPMLKFRTLKDKIVCSKRNSQKLTQEQLLSCFQEQPSLSRVRLSLNTKLQTQLNQLTHDNYKIPCQLPQKNKKVVQSSGKKRVHSECVRTESNEREDVNSMSGHLDFQSTAKKGMGRQAESSNFTRIIDLMKEVNELQQRKAELPRESEQLREQIKQRLSEVKVLIRSIEDDSQKSLMDFYNEEEHVNSPHSFHSHSSDQTYQLQSEREAYEFSGNKEHVDTNSTEEGNIEIKYRRLTPGSCQEEESIYEMFYEEEEETPQCSGFEDRSAEKSIVHLFSYDKENGLDTPLSRITEREEQYFSPESRHSSLVASLEYKKIYYLLETSEKKQTYRKEISEFTPCSHSKLSVQHNQSRLSMQSNESKDRSRCHEQLGEMISLLENKYHRKVKIGMQNLMDSLNLAIKDKSIKLRSRK